MKPRTNGRLAIDHAAGDSRLAQPVRLDRRDRRQVAGDERQHARRDDGDRGPRRTRPGADSAIEARELVVEPALELRVDRRAIRGGRRSPAAPRPAPGEPPERQPRPARSPANGSTHASRLNPCFDGSARIAGPNWATSFRLISLFVSPAAIRAEMNCRMRSAIGAVDWSSVVLHVGHITSPSSSPSVGWRSLAAAGAASTSGEEQRGRESHDSSARRIPEVSFVGADLARRRGRRRGGRAGRRSRSPGSP